MNHGLIRQSAKQAQQLAQLIAVAHKGNQNARPQLHSIDFQSAPCKAHEDPRVQSIIEAVRDNLPDYGLHAGKAWFTIHVGFDLSREELTSAEAFRLFNKELGLEMQFQLCQNSLNVIWLKRHESQQGKPDIRREIGRFKMALLDCAGFPFMEGEAIWSANSAIRNPTSKEKDWRFAFRYVGLDENLNPIFLRGLPLFYLRLGFIPGDHDDAAKCGKNVALLSDDAARQVKSGVGERIWQKMTQFSVENYPRWKQLQREREAQMSPSELRELKNNTLTSLNRSMSSS